MIVYRIKPGLGLNACCEKDPKELVYWLEQAEPGDMLTIDVFEMDEEKYETLPEFMGP